MYRTITNRLHWYYNDFHGPFFPTDSGFPNIMQRRCIGGGGGGCRQFNLRLEVRQSLCNSVNDGLKVLLVVKAME